MARWMGDASRMPIRTPRTGLLTSADAIVASNPDGIVVLDPGLHPVQWNPAAERLFAPDPVFHDPAALRAAVRQAISGGGQTRMLVDHRRSDGSEVTFSIMC